MADRRNAFGEQGEQAACDALVSRGYTILDRRFRTRCGELDIVARDGDVIVFVEVKARSDGSFGTPFDAITWRKRRRLSQMAASYVFQKQLFRVSCRFDIVAVTGRAAPFAVEIVQHAFDFGA